MVGNKDEVLQAIRKLTNDNGYVFFNNGGPYPPREHDEEVLYLSAQPKEGDNRPSLNFIVTIGSSRFRVTFDGAKVPEYFEDFNQMLIGITKWLQNNRG